MCTKHYPHHFKLYKLYTDGSLVLKELNIQQHFYMHFGAYTNDSKSS